VERFEQSGSQSGPTRAIEPDISVDHYRGERLGNLAKHGQQTRQLTTIELAGLILFNRVDPLDQFKGSALVRPVAEQNAACLGVVGPIVNVNARQHAM
jgi:hypothetical protein